MPTNPQPLSRRKAFNEMYFETNGNKKTGDYDVFLYIPQQPRVKIGFIQGNKRNGLKEARTFICVHLLNKMNKDKDFIFNQYCVNPERDEKKNEWNQFRISDYI